MALINIVCIFVSPNPRTAAIYYFITALFMLLACFDTYFALPLNVTTLELQTREIMMGVGNRVASVIMLTFPSEPCPHADFSK